MKKISIVILVVTMIFLNGCGNKNNDSNEGIFDLPDNYKYTTVNEGVACSEDGTFTNTGYYKYEICKYGSNFKLTTTQDETQTMTEAYAANYATQSGYSKVEDLMSVLESQYTISFKDGVYTLVMGEQSKTNYAKLNENSYLWDEYLTDSDGSSGYHFATKQIYKDKENQVETIRVFMEKSTYNDETNRYEFDLTKKGEIQGLEAYDNIEYINIYVSNGLLSKFEMKMTIKSDDVSYTISQTATFESYNEEITLPSNLIYCDHQYKDEVESIVIYNHYFHGYVCTVCGNIKDLTECELHDGKCKVCGYEENN